MLYLWLHYGITMGKINQKINGFTFDRESVTTFLRLLQKDQWGEEELELFLSTDGIRFILQCEEWDINSLREHMKEVGKGKELKGAPQGTSPWNRMWANRELIQEQHDMLENARDETVVRAFSTVKEFFPSWNHCEGTCFFVPGGSQKTYCTQDGCAINIGMERFSPPEWRFTIASLVYRFYLFSFLGYRPQNGTQETSLKMIEMLFNITHREGLSTYVGTFAADSPELTGHYALTDEDITLYTSAFENALEKNSFNGEDIKPESPLTRSATRIGHEMARAIDESGKEMGHTLGRDMLLGTLASRGFLPFFEMYRMGYPDGCITKAVWAAYDAVKKARGLHSVREDVFFMG